MGYFQFFVRTVAIVFATSVIGLRSVSADKEGGPLAEQTDAEPAEPDAEQSNGAEAAESDAAQTAAECVPSCRGGFRCVDGQCLSPCNPPCNAGESCTRNGHCLPLYREPPSTVQAPAARIPAEMSISPERVALNKRMYQDFKSKKSGGSAMMAVGSILIATAVGLGVGAGASGENALLIAGVAVEVCGDLLLFPGIAVYVTGKRGMEKASANFYAIGNRVGLTVTF